MTYELFWVSGSPNSWRAMLTLAHKNVPYISRRLDPTSGESKTAEYLAINPRGKVPAIRHGETIVHESIAVMAFLEREFPEKPLFGTTSAETGLIWQRILEFNNYARDPMDDGVSRPLMRGQAISAAGDVRAAAAKSHAALVWMEFILSEQPYLAGAALSAADFAAIPNIKWLERVGTHKDAVALELALHDLVDLYPNVGKWIARIEALPAWDAAYPPHWRKAN